MPLDILIAAAAGLGVFFGLLWKHFREMRFLAVRAGSLVAGGVFLLAYGVFCQSAHRWQATAIAGIIIGFCLVLMELSQHPLHRLFLKLFPPAMADVLEIMQSGRELVRQVGFSTFRTMDVDPSRKVAAIKSIIRKRSVAQDLPLAGSLLRNLEELGRPALPLLVSLVGDVPEFDGCLANILSRFGAEAVPFLVEGFAAVDPQLPGLYVDTIRIQIILEVLHSIGPEAVPHLRVASQHTDPNISRWVSYLLEKIGTGEFEYRVFPNLRRGQVDSAPTTT